MNKQSYNPIVIADIEGTLTNCKHRIHHLENKDYDKWNEGFVDDTYHLPTLALLLMFSRNVGIAFSTAKPAKYKEMVLKSLRENIPFPFKLFMRSPHDERKSPLVKQDVVTFLRHDGYDIVYAIDDRQDIIDMYIKQKVPTLKVTI